MIFLAGIHGAGKTTFCTRAVKELGIECVSASGLIEAVLKQKMPKNKEIRDIERNQRLLEYAVRLMGISCENILMEGHLCLLDENGEIARISAGTFDNLAVQRIIVLREEISVIAGRNRCRGSLLSSPEFIDKFQNEELQYGRELSEKMQIPFHIIANTEAGFYEFTEIWKEIPKK